MDNPFQFVQDAQSISCNIENIWSHKRRYMINVRTCNNSNDQSPRSVTQFCDDELYYDNKKLLACQNIFHVFNEICF